MESVWGTNDEAIIVDLKGYWSRVPQSINMQTFNIDYSIDLRCDLIERVNLNLLFIWGKPVVVQHPDTVVQKPAVVHSSIQ
jgi:hypothetical protein